VDAQQVLEEFLMAGRANGLRPATLKWYSSVLTAFAQNFPGRALNEITTKDLRQYIIELEEREARYVDAPQKPTQEGGLSKSSIAGHITALHAFFKWASTEYQQPNPMANIKRRRRAAPEPKAITARDFVKLFQAATDNEAGIRDRAMLTFLADSGCRLGGLQSLTIQNLDLAQRRAIVAEKGDRRRTVVFTTFTARLLAKWLNVRSSSTEFVFTSLSDGERLTASGINQVLKRLKARAEVTGRVNPHSFRHNFARAYLENGGNIVSLAKLLGHADINTTAAYYAVFTHDELAEMHSRFSPLNQVIDELA
jgi:site-specific recombinase XerD